MKTKSEYLRRKEARRQTIITGIVAPCDWDEHHNVIAVEIATPGEEEYLVDNNAKGQELLKCVHEQVKVVGIVKKNKKGNQIITVKEHEIVREKSEDEYSIE